MASMTIEPGGALRGAVRVPGDKSVTHRAVMLGALADGEMTIRGYCRGEDCLNTVRAFRGMGIHITEEAERLRMFGKGPWGLAEPDGPIDCGNSGTSLRLLAGLLSGQDFFTVLTGDQSVRHRPMGRVVKPLRQMGATIAGRKGGELAPLALVGNPLRGITYDSPVASAQIKSSLLFAGLFAEGITRIREPQPSRDHTERLFQHLGLPIRWGAGSVEVEGHASHTLPGGKTLIVPGDLSAAAFFLVAATIVPGSEVTIRDVGVNPTRTGLVEILQEMGADIEVLNQREESGEPVGDLLVRSADLHGTRIGADRIPQTIDEFPVFCVAAALAEGETEVSGAAELRVKESDRIAAMVSQLGQMGVPISETSDGVVIQGLGGGKARQSTKRLRGARGASQGDHRVAMALAVAGLVADGPTTIEGTDCIETSFPGFEGKLLELLTRS